MFNLYILEDWYGGLHLMSSSKIHKKVMDDSSKSNYNWITSATKLVDVCSRRNFPTEYANDIKMAILNCYSVLIHSKNQNSRREKTDLSAVYFAYNSLYGVEDEKVIQARARFLNSFLSLIIWNTFLGLVHHGENFKNACNEWQKLKFDELFAMENIDFNDLTTTLAEDFSKRIKMLEESGAFDEEDKKEQERLRNFLNSKVDAFFEKHDRQKMLSRVHTEQK